MVYTAERATAQELASYGSVLKVVPRDQLREAAREVARQIAEVDPVVIRAAKESLNGIDPVDVRRSYRYEQGFTFELNLTGRQRQGARRVRRPARAAGRSRTMPDKRTTDRRGRRRAPRRDDDRHRRLGLAAQADGVRARAVPHRRQGPDRRVVRRTGRRVCCARPARCARLSSRSSRWTRSRSSRTSATRCRPARSTTLQLDEGMFLLGLQAAAWRVPFLPTRVGLGSDVVARQAEIRTVTSPYDDAEELVAMPALPLDVALDSPEPRRRGRQRAVPRAGPLLRRPHVPGGATRVRLLRADRRHRRSAQGRLASHAARSAGCGPTASSRRRTARTSRRASPTTSATRRSRRDYAATAKSPEAWAEWRTAWLDLDEDGYQQKLAQRDDAGDRVPYRRADVCCVAIAEVLPR